MKSLFEQLDGIYCKQGDYLILNLILFTREENNIGIYGQRHLKFLQEQHRLTYTNLITSGANHIQVTNFVLFLKILYINCY